MAGTIVFWFPLHSPSSLSLYIFIGSAWSFSSTHDVCLIRPWSIKQTGCSPCWFARSNSDSGIYATSGGKPFFFAVVWQYDICQSNEFLGFDTCLELGICMQKTATGFLSVFMAGCQYCKSPHCIYFCHLPACLWFLNCFNHHGFLTSCIETILWHTRMLETIICQLGLNLITLVISP